MTSFIKINKVLSIDIHLYYRRFVLKELLQKVKKVKNIKIPKKKKYEGSYREYQRSYQREYQRNYYHTHRKLNKVGKPV
jgi:hypothetical protein